MPALKEYLSEIESASSVKIPFGKDNVFCFDNEAFRYLMLAHNASLSEEEGERNEHANSWLKSRQNALNLVKYVVERLPVMQIQQLIALHDSKEIRFDEAKETMRVLEMLLAKCHQLAQDKALKGNQNKIRQLNETADKLIKCSAQISFLISKDCITVFNDDMEAYLEEKILDEERKRCSGLQDVDSKERFQSILTKYQKFKKQASKQTFDSNSLNELYDRLYTCIEAAEKN